MTDLISTYKSKNTIVLNNTNIDNIDTYFNNMIAYAIRQYEQSVKDVVLEYSTHIQSIDHETLCDGTQVTINYILIVNFYPNSEKYYNLNHLKIKNPKIFETVNDHSGTRRLLTYNIMLYTGSKRVSFSTNMGFFPDPWFTEILERKS